MEPNFWDGVPRLRVIAAIAAVAAAATACGGGGGGGGGGVPFLPAAPPPSGGDAPPPPPPPPPPAEPPAPTSSACTNEADFREGTVLEAEFNRNLIREPGLGAEKVYYKLEGRQAFAGKNPIAISSHGDGIIVERSEFKDTEFTDLVDGNILSYGRRITWSDSLGSRTNTLVYDPPLARPVSMKEGEVVTRKYKMKVLSVYTPAGRPPNPADLDQTLDLETEFTFSGIHSLSTVLGSYNSCTFYSNTKTTTPGQIFDNRLKYDIPTEGPYRGQVVGTSSYGVGGWQDFPVKMVYTPK
jgi:hypothetical protein